MPSGRYLRTVLLIVFTAAIVFAAAAENEPLPQEGFPPPPNEATGTQPVVPFSDTVGQPAAAPDTVAPPAEAEKDAAGIGNMVVAEDEYKPKDISAKVSGMRVTLAWKSASPETTDFDVYRSTSASAGFVKINKAAVKGLSFTDSKTDSAFPPKHNTTYYYKVVALLAGKEAGESDTATATPFGPIAPPEKILVYAGNNNAFIKWAEPESSGEFGVSGFNIFRSEQQGEQGKKINEKLLSVYSYEDKGLTTGARYYYSLNSVDKAGNTSAASEQVVALPFDIPGMPRNVTTKAMSQESVKIMWDAPESQGTFGVSIYNIYRTESLGGSPDKPINMKPVKPYTDENGKLFYYDNIVNSETPPQAGKTYYYSVCAIDVSGNTGAACELVAAGIEMINVPQSGILSADISEFGLPPESKLTISGQKSVKMGYAQAWPDDARTSKGFTIDQGLRVKLEGNIGKKIIVDVDYNDQNPENENTKISIRYEGDKEETVQEASFGDISLNLPPTRFVSFSQTLFGVKVKLKLGDKLTATGIFAQTKGITAVQSFIGNLREKEDNGQVGVYIQDNAFIKDQYFYITRDPGIEIEPGSVIIYYDNNISTDNNVNTVYSTPNSRYAFDRKYLGSDYTVDYKNRTIKFNYAIDKSHTIAVAYRTTAGASVGYTAGGVFDFDEAGLIAASDGRTESFAHLIQDGKQESPRDISHKVMNYYQLSETQIFNPLVDREYFTIKVKNKSSGQEIYMPQPWDADASTFYDIDTDFGIIKFKAAYPFSANAVNVARPDDLGTQSTTGLDSDAYNISDPQNKYEIFLKYKYYVSSYRLDRFPIVYGSERIFVNGRQLKKDIDYYLFYETGEITFIDNNLIQPSTEIRIVYEYFPFMQTYASNLMGARLEYQLLDNLKIGGTVLKKDATGGRTVPDARSTDTGLSTPYSMYIMDGDIKFDLDRETVNKIITALPVIEKSDLPVDMSFAGEIAYSGFNVNTFEKSDEKGVAMIDNMEGADNVIGTSMEEDYWFPASQPQNAFDFPASDRIQLPKKNETAESHETLLTTGVTAATSNKKLMLQFDLGGIAAGRWDAYRYIVSGSGENLNVYNYLETWIYSDTSAPVKLMFDVGVISEDTNGNGQLDTEDDKTNPNGIFTTEKDIGITRDGSAYYGAGNEYLDTEDMNNNGSLDTTDRYYQYTHAAGTEITVSGKGWHNIKIPLKEFQNYYNVDSNPNSKQFLSLVRHVRISVKPQGAPSSGSYIRIESLEFTGNSWQLKTAASSVDLAGNVIDAPDNTKLNVLSVNKSTDGSYNPNTKFFDYQREEDKNAEEALKLTYNLSRYDTRPDGLPIYYLAKLLSNSLGYDYQPYQNLKADILVRSKGSMTGKVLYFRVGTGTNYDTGYYQYNTVIDDIPADGEWHTITFRLDGSDKKRGEPAGTPNLRRVQYISIGVLNPGNISEYGELYINNIRLTDPEEKKGAGKYTNSNMNYEGFGTVTHSYEDRESDFNTIVDAGRSQIRQHYTSNSVGFNYTQIPFLPMNNTYSKTENYTEKKYAADPVYTNNYSLPDSVSEQFNNSLSLNVIPGITIGNNTSFSNVQNRYLGYYGYNDHNLKDFSVRPNAGWTLPQEIKVGDLPGLPIGSNNIQANWAFTHRETDYAMPEKTTYCATCYDQWRISREQYYKWTGGVNAGILTVSPVYEFKLTEEKGYMTSRFLYYYYDMDTYNYADRYLVMTRENKPGLTLSLQEIGIFTPMVQYGTSHRRDYTQNQLQTNGNLDFSTGVGLSKVVPGIPDISSYRFGINLTDQYTSYYPDSFDRFEALSFETKWNTSLWQQLADEKEIMKLEAIAYSGSQTVSHSVSLSEIKISDRFGFSPSADYSVRRSSQLRQLNSLSEQIGARAGNMHLDGITIPGLDWAVKNETMTGNYSYSKSRTKDPVDRTTVTNDQTTHSGDVTLPYKTESKFSGHVKMAMSLMNTEDRFLKWYLNTYSPEFRINYTLSLVDPITVPGWIPFLGNKVFKFEQNLNLYTLFSLQMTRGDDEGGRQTYLRKTDYFSATLGGTYNVLENIKTSLDLRYENMKNMIDERSSYNKFSVTAEVVAYF